MPAKKKTVKKKKAVSSGKTVAKKKAVAKKKVAAKKKVVAKKKVAAKKKAVAKHKVPAKKKSSSKKKAVAKHKVAAKKKSSPKKKTAAKKKVIAKKPVSKKTAKKSAKKKSVKKKQWVDIDYDDPRDHIVASSTAGPLEFNPYQVASREEYMSDTQVDHFKVILIDWKSQLMAEVDSTVGHLQHDAEAYADPLDRAAQEEGFNLELRTRDRERKLIKKIEQALDWIEEGVYGYCEDCGAEIGVRRLEARPTAAKCIDCKTYAEIREKQVGG